MIRWLGLIERRDEKTLLGMIYKGNRLQTKERLKEGSEEDMVDGRD